MLAYISFSMDDGSSKDVETVEYVDSEDDDSESRPIMLLLRRLIKNKQNTVMTNAQIINILHKEFDIDITSLHELEVDVYIKIVKKFLKDWPQWEELERISTKLSNIKDYDAVNKVLNHNYKNLKEYLGVMLEAAKPLAKNAVEKVEAASTSKKAEDTTTEAVANDSADVIMEVQCTRSQLNHLFFRRPRLDLNRTVFNKARIQPSRIALKEIKLDDILNAWAVKITINLPFLIYVREVIYDLKHTLVNFARTGHILQDLILDPSLLMKPQTKVTYKTKDIFVSHLNAILKGLLNTEGYEAMNSIFKILIDDMQYLPETISIPAMYKKFGNKYKYVRYLCVENDENTDPQYNLQLEEILSPMYFYSFAKLSSLPQNLALPAMSNWFHAECMMCKAKFPGSSILKSSLELHFSSHHQDETDWQCTHCKCIFSLDYLAKRRWQHEC